MRPKVGKADTVFNEEKETVKALAQITDPSLALAAKILAWSGSLLTAGRSIAATAIAEGGTARDLAKGDTDQSNVQVRHGHRSLQERLEGAQGLARAQ